MYFNPVKNTHSADEFRLAEKAGASKNTEIKIPKFTLMHSGISPRIYLAIKSSYMTTFSVCHELLFTYFNATFKSHDLIAPGRRGI